METIIKFKTFVKTVIRSVNVQESNITQLINASIRNGLDRPDMLNVSIWVEFMIFNINKSFLESLSDIGF